MRSASTPPTTKPSEKPTGCAAPRHEKATFLLCPVENEPVMMLTALGRQKEMAMPERARKMISWIPVLARPHPNVKMARSTHPVRYIGRLPTTSATDPERRRVHPQVNAYTDAGLASVNPKYNSQERSHGQTTITEDSPSVPDLSRLLATQP